MYYAMNYDPKQKQQWALRVSPFKTLKGAVEFAKRKATGTPFVVVSGMSVVWTE